MPCDGKLGREVRRSTQYLMDKKARLPASQVVFKGAMCAAQPFQLGVQRRCGG
jgi:hypothetical protein